MSGVRDDGDSHTGGDTGDDEIVEDPFFLRYSCARTLAGAASREEARSAPSSEYSSDGERLVVPRSPRAFGSSPTATLPYGEVSFESYQTETGAQELSKTD